MTLIEFHEAAKAIVEKAGWQNCHVSTHTTVATYSHDAKTLNLDYKITAHPPSGILTSWADGMPLSCNNPRLALERFQTVVDRRLAPPSEPEAITEIEFGAVNYETKPIVVVIGSVDLTPSEPTISVSADGSTIEYTNPATEYSIKSKAIQVEGSEAGNG